VAHGTGVVWSTTLRHLVLLAARLECMLAAGSRPSKREMRLELWAVIGPRDFAFALYF